MGSHYNIFLFFLKNIKKRRKHSNIWENFQFFFVHYPGNRPKSAACFHRKIIRWGSIYVVFWVKVDITWSVLTFDPTYEFKIFFFTWKYFSQNSTEKYFSQIRSCGVVERFLLEKFGWKSPKTFSLSENGLMFRLPDVN